MAQKRRKNLLERAKGYRHGRSKKERYAHEALLHAGKYAFAHRRDKKGEFRRLWNVRINAALRAINPENSYSKFMGAMKKSGITLDRKSLATLADENPEAFKKIVEKVS